MSKRNFVNKYTSLIIAAVLITLIGCDGGVTLSNQENTTTATQLEYDPLVDADRVLAEDQVPLFGAASVDPATVGGNYFQITDRWVNGELRSIEGSEFLAYSDAGVDNIGSHWSTEAVVDEWFRIKNRQTGDYIHIQPADGVVRLDDAPAGYWSGHWRFNMTGDYFRIENRWLTNHRINVEDQDGVVRHGIIPDTFWSGQWTLKPVDGAANNPSRQGQWSDVIDWPLIGIHAALTADGKVLTYGTDSQGIQGGQFIYDVWNPNLGTGTDSHATLPNNTGTDIFCSAQMLLPGSDNMLLSGGDVRGLNTGQMTRGVSDVNIFNSTSNSLSRSGAMNYARWYPTLTALPNEEILVQGGIDMDGRAVTTPEIYNQQSGTWRLLSGAVNYVDWWYPRNWVAPNGTIFGISGDQIYQIDTQGTGSYEELGVVTGTNKSITSTAVMYRPGRILQIGGGVRAAESANADASTQVTEYNINGATPTVIERADMAFPRHWANATVLPDGKVLVTGGSAAANYLNGVAQAAEIYDPTTQQWLTAASAVEDRLYHSTALLLPDASVLVAGGGAPAARDLNGNPTPGNLNAEIYYPPYFFDENNNRRTLLPLTAAPDQVQLGSTFAITPADAATIREVNLVRVGSVTHSFNMDQRFIPLRFTRSGAQLEVVAPLASSVAPPGTYLLFAVDQNGVPSTASMISVVTNDSDWFQLSDRWRKGELHVNNNQGVVAYGDVPGTDRASHWTEEPLGSGGWVRLKNRSTGGYMHVQPNNGSVAVGDLDNDGWWSAQWGKEIVDGHTVYRNRWLSAQSIHVQSQGTVAEHGAVPRGFWSSQWEKIPVQ